MSCQRAECKRAGRCGCSEMATTLTTTLLPGAPTITVHPQPPPAPSGLCAKCGERHATQAILTMVERPGATLFYCDECAKPPQWSTTPPRATPKPQFFWFRLGKDGKQIPVEVFEIGGYPFCNTFGQIAKLSHRDGGEWYPVRISEPPR